jgi:hypothetical protein
MKKNIRFLLIAICCLLSVVLSGCVTIKEMSKGFMGVSTQVLEDKRKDALKKSFTLGYSDCYAKVKDILAKDVLVKDTLDNETNAPYIYMEDAKKKMIAIYLSPTDTTPVGIFFTDQTGVSTLIEISSPSIYAKEEIANRIFKGLVSDSQSQKEKSSDVK